MYRIDFIVLKSAYIWKSSRAESNHKENYGALDPPPPQLDKTLKGII